MGPYCCLASVLTISAVRLLPEHLDLLTACDGCAGIGGVIGGIVAVLAEQDIGKGGVIGAAIGLVFGLFFVLVQGSGVHL